MTNRTDKKILLIGWDAADWKIINPLMDAGKMPNLEQLVERGVMGNLSTLYPELSPMLWTSIATGKRPFNHGIHGFTEPDPDGQGVRPVTNLSRTTKALWNILSQNSMPCNVIGWWPSHPAEPINGVMVSNHYQRIAGKIDEPWPVMRGAVHPVRITDNLARLRVHPQQLDGGHIQPFVPDISGIDQEKDHRLETLAKIICETLSIRNAALAIMHHEPWRFTGVYFDGIDHFGHAFMRYNPPRQPWVDEKDFEIYSHVVESGYILHDIILGALLEEAGKDTTIIIVSDHGFHSDHLRPRHIPHEPAGPAAQHRPYGIFVMAGPGIKKDELIHGASLLDICPTVLTLLGLPVGEDMDGKPLVQAFENPPTVSAIPSWDAVTGTDGMHDPTKRIDPVEAQEAIQQLVALGYIEKPPENKQQAIDQCVRELNYNLARAYMDASRHGEAAALLEELLEKWPNEYRFGIHLVSCLQALDRTPEARRVLEDLLSRKQKNAGEALPKLKELREKLGDKTFEDMTEQEKEEIQKLQTAVSQNPYAMEYLMGRLLFGEGRLKESLEHLLNAARADTGQPGLYAQIGEVYLRQRRYFDANENFGKALELDPDHAPSHLGRCRSLLGLKSNFEAVDEALESIGLNYHSPVSHFLLAAALHRLGRFEEAIKALQVAVQQNPNFPAAYRRMAFIYRRGLKDPEKAAECRHLATEAVQRIRNRKQPAAADLQPHPGAGGAAPQKQGAEAEISAPVEAPVDRREIVTIVSGLPRSGTSMLMQMLAAGGLAPFSDGERTADEDNPKGYYEHEKVKALARDNAWLGEAKGSCIKIVSQLLKFLPAGLPYRIIFIDRNLDEVVRSQRVMIERQSGTGAKLTDERLKEAFRKQVEIAKIHMARSHMHVLYLNYDLCVGSPAEAARQVNAFLGGGLDEAAMAAAVDAGLKRQKAKPAA